MNFANCKKVRISSPTRTVSDIYHFHARYETSNEMSERQLFCNTAISLIFPCQTHFCSIYKVSILNLNGIGYFKFRESIVNKLIRAPRFVSNSLFNLQTEYRLNRNYVPYSFGMQTCSDRVCLIDARDF